MSNNGLTNLDSLCAQHGYAIVQAVAPNGSLPKGNRAKLENTITKSLGVLQENGVYAFFLYLRYRKGETGSPETESQVLNLLRHTKVNLLLSDNDPKLLPCAHGIFPFPALQQLTDNLDNLILARQLLEQALIYARYHAKALEETR